MFTVNLGQHSTDTRSTYSTIDTHTSCTSLALSGFPSSAAPIPPLTENSLGQPMLTSTAATSPSTIFATARARCGSDVPWRGGGGAYLQSALSMLL